MSQISRLYDFQAGTKIYSSQVDDELNQIVKEINKTLDIATTTDEEQESGTIYAILATLSPVPTEYLDGMKVTLRAGGNNTLANVTVNLNSLGAKSLIRYHDGDSTSYSLEIGEWKKGCIYEVMYLLSIDKFVLVDSSVPRSYNSDNLSGMSASSSATVSTIAARTSSGGRLKAGVATESDDVVTKSQMDAVNSTLTAHTSNTSNPHSTTKSQVGLGNCDNTSDVNKPVSTAQAAALLLKVDKVTGKSLILDTLISKLEAIAAGAEVNVQADWTEASSGSDAYIKNKPTLGTVANKNTGTTAGTIPILDSNGKLAVSIIPVAAISNTTVISSEVEMLALTAQVGDLAIRTDLNKSFILQTEPASTLSNWAELLTPTDLVTSVCGKQGVVTLSADDVGALDTSDIYDALDSTATNKTLSANQGKALITIIGQLSGLNAFFTSTARDSLVNAINALLTYVGTDSFNSYYSGITTLIGCINKLATDKVTSSTIVAVRYNEGNFEYTTDGSNWTNLTGDQGIQGIQGKSYNPRGSWVSGGTYTNDSITIDVVYYNGASYYCTNSITGTTAPDTDASHWGLLASADNLASSMLMTGYLMDSSFPQPVEASDDVSEAIGKLEARMIPVDTVLSNHYHNVGLSATWTPIALPIVFACKTLAYGEGKFLTHNGSTGSQNYLISEDGITWEYHVGTNSVSFLGLRYCCDKFIRVGSSKIEYQSPTTGSWVSVTSPSGGWTDVCYGNSLYVIVGDSSYTARLLTSSDGITWTTITPGQNTGWNSVCYGEHTNMFVAVGSSGSYRVLYSTDGGSTWGSTNTADAYSWMSVCHGSGGFGERFVAVGTDRIMYSNDGVTWTNFGYTGAWKSVCFGNGMFVAVGTNKMACSADGINWVEYVPNENNSWVKVEYGDGVFVVLSTNGTYRAVRVELPLLRTSMDNPNYLVEEKSIIKTNESFTAIPGCSYILNDYSTTGGTKTITIPRNTYIKPGTKIKFYIFSNNYKVADGDLIKLVPMYRIYLIGRKGINGGDNDYYKVTSTGYISLTNVSYIELVSGYRTTWWLSNLIGSFNYVTSSSDTTVYIYDQLSGLPSRLIKPAVNLDDSLCPSGAWSEGDSKFIHTQLIINKTSRTDIELGSGSFAAPLGAILEIIGRSSAGWRVYPIAGSSIIFNGTTLTSATWDDAQYIESGAYWNSIKLVVTNIGTYDEDLEAYPIEYTVVSYTGTPVTGTL